MDESIKKQIDAAEELADKIARLVTDETVGRGLNRYESTYVGTTAMIYAMSGFIGAIATLLKDKVERDLYLKTVAQGVIDTLSRQLEYLPEINQRPKV